MEKLSIFDLVLRSPGRFIMPIGAYTGLNWTKGTVREIVSNPDLQVESVLALNDHLSVSRAPYSNGSEC